MIGSRPIAAAPARAGRISLRDGLAAGTALGLLGVASLMLAVLPFRRVAPLLGRAGGPRGYVPLLGPAQEERAVFVGRAIARAAGVAPFRADCLPQAMVAAMFARVLRLPLAVHLGARIEGGALGAHAWARAGRVAVTGGGGLAEHATVHCFLVGIGVGVDGGVGAAGGGPAQTRWKSRYQRTKRRTPSSTRTTGS